MKHRNPYDKRFWRTIIEKSVAKTEGAAINEWTHDAFRKSDSPFFSEPPECICGRKGIVDVYILRNVHNGNLILVGSCCVRRWKIPIPGWRGKRNYLQSVLLMVRSQKEKEFVKGLLSKAVKYAKLIISEKQKRWLEDITGHPWRGKVWPETPPCSRRHSPRIRS